MKIKNFFAKTKKEEIAVEDLDFKIQQNRILKKMDEVDPLSDEYQELLDRLHDVKEFTKPTIECVEKSVKKVLDPNVVLTCAVSLLEVGDIVYNEYGRVIASKALNFIKRV